ncbi:efflux RND transporter permease subunit [Polyangium fumosum]|uniref:Efflux RND transporter permease subunit n=1 Tax=Polyangium fumosum TaxID=889272 RepID=A0A4U1IVY2_9BACT|nr:CusA/CzcA family heavy metal efflux RND transporter [Polyangium fumosum]TKC98317.1 efflux RND transporter permease subunit [Polyangium fumosum]
MFKAIARFAVRRWPFVVTFAALFATVGVQAFRSLPIEAFPDVTNPMVEVVGVYQGQAAEEVEKKVTLELERVVAGTPRLIDIRSVSVFGLCLMTLTFEEGTPDFEMRTLVAERLRDAELPASAETILGPQATPVGQIYRYTLRGDKPLRELRALQDFVVERRLRAVPGVAEVVTFGGFERQYQVRIDPARLAATGISVQEVYEALEKTNTNAGGGYVGIGSQEFVVRGVGALRSPADIGLAVVREVGGVPVLLQDIATVVEGSTPRRGSVGRGHEDEVVEGIVLLRRGQNPSVVLEALKERIEQLNRDVLPRGVTIDAFYDRTSLVDATLGTVKRNMAEGALLVVAVVYLFLRTLRGALLIFLVIPLSLLAAFVGLKLMGLPANLISLGAIDFGIIVDGAVIVLETTLHFMHGPRAPGEDKRSVIERATGSVAKPVIFSMLIIIAALAPIFSLERVEGRIFAPMAYTYAFALLGALACAAFVVPALETIALPEHGAAEDARWLQWLRRSYLRLLARAARMRLVVLAASGAAAIGGAVYASGIGTEFLPELNEGGFYITSTFPSTISLDETRSQVRRIREKVLRVPEVVDVLSHIGRPEAATQAEGPNNAEFFVPLRPEAEWRPGSTRRTLEAELRQSLRAIPGVQYNFSQPITDRVFETISGIIGQVVVKVHGEDLKGSTELAEKIREKLGQVQGVTDLAIYMAGDNPQLRIDIHRDAIARRGLAIDDVQSTIAVALGGAVATEVWEGERRHGVALRLPDAVRADPSALGRLIVGDAETRATLGEVATIELGTGRSAVWREDFSRFVAVKFNVRGRDLGSVVEDGQRAVATLGALPEGTYISWGGEFQNQRRAMRRLGIALPLAVLAILAILYANFRRFRPTLMILAFLPLALVGAVAGLRLMGENFSVSSAVGCIALLGQLVLAGVLICSRIDEIAETNPHGAMLEGAETAFRPVVLTTSLALLGLLPAALSHAMGSETQRPFAIAIIAGLLAGIPAILFVLPVAYAGRRRAAPVEVVPCDS